ncbi:hypothetical protein WJX72_003390 [[Myrmecia] bisecta]|uniref:Proton pump-interactor 1 n=1 Tax=[Myrmecia] bisecta TaxID=41462 RepID=A0AAW1PXJ6_9CHLO
MDVHESSKENPFTNSTDKAHPAVPLSASSPNRPLNTEESGLARDDAALGVDAMENNGAAERATTASPEESARAAEEAQWKKRLWFVRVPKPAEDSTLASFESELELYKARVHLLNESVNIKRMEKDSARESTKAALEALNACKAQIDLKDRDLKPLRDARDARNIASKEFRSNFGDLDVRSEEELDDKLKSIEHRMSHESMPLAEEKKLMAQMKKLQGQRERVRQYAVKVSSLSVAREEADKLQLELKELDQDRQVLVEERQMQSKIFEKYRDEERALDAELKAILDERRRVKDLQDDVYQRMQEVKRERRAKTDEYYENRRFSQNIRIMVRDGGLDEARALCAEQANSKHELLEFNPDYRIEFVRLWDQQRKYPLSMSGDASFDLDPLAATSTSQPACKGAKGSKREGRPGRGEQDAAPAALPSKSRAELVIAAALEEAKEEIAQNARNKAAEPAPEPAPVEEEAPAPVKAPVQVLGAPSPDKLKPVRAPKPAAKAPIVLPEVHDATPFVPPVVSKSAPLSEEELREKARLHNKAALAEAEKRKERKRREAEKRQQKAAERKAREAVAAQAAKVQEEQTGGVDPAPPGEVAAEAAPAAESPTVEAAAPTSASASAASSAGDAASAMATKAAGGGKAGGAKPAKVIPKKLQPPKARSKKKAATFVAQAGAWLVQKQNMRMVGGAAVAAFLAVLVVYILFISSA